MCIRDRLNPCKSCGDVTSPGCCGSEAFRSGGAAISEIVWSKPRAPSEILEDKVQVGGFGLACTRQSKAKINM